MRERSTRGRAKVHFRAASYGGFMQCRLPQPLLLLPHLQLLFANQNLKPREDRELRPGLHVFAVYGDTFYSKAPYVLEAIDLSAAAPAAATATTTAAAATGSAGQAGVVSGGNGSAWAAELRESEAQLLAKRGELQKFEVLAPFPLRNPSPSLLARGCLPVF